MIVDAQEFYSMNIMELVVHIVVREKYTLALKLYGKGILNVFEVGSLYSCSNYDQSLSMMLELRT